MKQETSRIKEMEELIEKILRADLAYYKHDDPVMTDRDYDRLVDELKELEAETGVVLSLSPTQKVSGEILPELAQVRHTKPMLSADKTKDVEELVRFTAGKDTVLSWKLDGLTLVLRYAGGRFLQAVTRGREGIIGEDVTHSVRHCLNVPISVPEERPFEVRGEGVISWKHFEEINSSLEEPYRHPRGLAAGSVRKLDTTDSRERMVEFIAFELIMEDAGFTRKQEQFDFLSRNGFAAVPHLTVRAADPAPWVKRLADSFDPKSYGYPVDGLIMEYDDLAYGKSLGATGHHENRMIALKWEDEMVETKFIRLETAVTRNGMVSLTGIFEPVMIDGTEVSRAYLHNIDIWEGLALGKGDTIKVYKANMIIPQIGENLTRSGKEHLPEECPCCGSKLEIRTSSGGTRQLFCSSRSCAAKLVRKFVHFCDKTRMDIEGLSEKTLAKFIGMGWIRNFGDLYTLEDHREEIVQTEGFGEKSFARLQASIERSRHCRLDKFIAGMGIPMVGRTAGRIISAYFGGDPDRFFQAIEDGFDFTVLEGFGDIMDENIRLWYADAEAAKLWKPLLKHLEFETEKEEQVMETTETVFKGKTIVATGKLVNYTRDGINERILSLGAKPGSSVTKKTDYLIVGEKAGSKLAKAQKLGVPVLTEEEFEQMAS